MKKIYHFLCSIVYFWRCLIHGLKYKKGVQIKRGLQISRGTKVILSEKCTISHHVSFWGGGTIVLGENTHIGSYSSIYSCKEGGVIFGSNVNCARNLFIIDTNHCYADKSKLICEQGLTSEKIVIGNNCWIGGNCTIIKGAAIGDGTVVGACTLVNKKFPDNVVLGGVPAKILKNR